MGYDTSILNFVTLGLKFCFANSFDSCRMGGLALFTIQVFSKTFSVIFVQNGKFIKKVIYSQFQRIFPFLHNIVPCRDFNCPSKMIKTTVRAPS